MIVHYDECSDGPLHFCSGGCARQAEYEASLEADVGGGFEPHFWDEVGRMYERI